MRSATSGWVCTTVCAAVANFSWTVLRNRLGIAAIVSRRAAWTFMAYLYA
ncbi:hypothetical protein PP352_25040 [Mycobacteroides abscessus]|nr:hypothetical protein [Mycobacteroides abscessus]